MKQKAALLTAALSPPNSEKEKGPRKWLRPEHRPRPSLGSGRCAYCKKRGIAQRNRCSQPPCRLTRKDHPLQVGPTSTREESSQAPTILQSGSTLTLQVGDTLTLPCVISTLTPLGPIKWIRESSDEGQSIVWGATGDFLQASPMTDITQSKNGYTFLCGGDKNNE
ncbi:uncharacterized protein LOC126060433 isoform X2 [Elephas maximus indicus]|uniref:uncharacterized protein LOC126060433 isoform X2 n=1 Tax=Elephas maximus indicus TaxID=99487 RepID=UPI002116F96F|nr:uncharacterized protein LOC126060433 isoform X2 [Elephas maximus indicus]